MDCLRSCLRDLRAELDGPLISGSFGTRVLNEDLRSMLGEAVFWREDMANGSLVSNRKPY